MMSAKVFAGYLDLKRLSFIVVPPSANRGIMIQLRMTSQKSQSSRFTLQRILLVVSRKTH